MAAVSSRTLNIPKTIYDNSWYINGNSCKNKQLMTIHRNSFFSIPLRVYEKVVILHCRFGTLRTYSVTTPKGSR